MNTIEAIKARRSVRTFTGMAISEPHRNSIESEVAKLSAMYGVRLSLIKNSYGGKQFGTYGLIKNPDAYITCVCKNDTLTIIQAGMALEKAVLHCTALGIGTCWLGGTFKRDEFGSAVTVADGEVMPAVIAAGYPTEKEGLIGSLMRVAAKSKARKPFGELFFDGDFSHPLSPTDNIAAALELVRVGPSASNKQPWRIVKNGGCLHFFVEHTPAYATRYAFDMQLLDIGIAMSHFELAMEANGASGAWQAFDKDFGGLPRNTEYITSWVGAGTK